MVFTIAKGSYYDSLGKGGKLTFDPKTNEYTCYVDQKKQWTEVADPDLYFYVKSHCDEYGDFVKLLDYSKLMSFPIYQRYKDSVG